MIEQTEEFEPGELIDQKLDRLAELLKDQPPERVSLVGEILANGRLHFGRSSGELFTGAAVGRACYGGSCPMLVLGELGVSFEVAPASAVLSVNPAMVSDSIRYADAQASFSWTSDQVEIGALFGHRFGDALTVLSADTRTWASVTASRWIVPRVALVASGGTYPIDPTQGFPGGRFVSLSVRVKTGILRRPRSSRAVLLRARR